MSAVDLHPALRVARAFDAALSRASSETALSQFDIGALCAVLVIAEAAGLRDDPRYVQLQRRIAASLVSPSGDRVA